MKNSKREKMKIGTTNEIRMERDNGAPTRITDQMWRNACEDGAKARALIAGLTFPNGARVKAVQLENGNEIPVSKVTDEQACNFLKMLAPERIWTGYRQ